MKHIEAGISDNETKRVLKDYISRYGILIIECKTALRNYQNELKQLKKKLALYNLNEG